MGRESGMAELHLYLCEVAHRLEGVSQDLGLSSDLRGEGGASSTLLALLERLGSWHALG